MSTILLVEDDQWLADCYQLWLKKAGHNVVWVGDAQAAMDALDTTKPDVIMLDMLLPQVNGIRLLHELHSYPDLTDIPIILCSNALPDSPHLAAYGVIESLDKSSLTPKKLRSAIDAAVNRHATI